MLGVFRWFLLSFLRVILMSADVAKWPVPEVLTDRTYVYLASVQRQSAANNGGIGDFIDVYIDTDETGYQSVVFADKWSTENNTYGSMPLDCFLSYFTSEYTPNSPAHFREIFWHILNTGKLQFSPKEVVDDSENNG
jgi:hypothetical protein